MARPNPSWGKCGEEIAAHLYYLFNEGRPLTERGAVVDTLGADRLNNAMPYQKDPCGVEGR